MHQLQPRVTTGWVGRRKGGVGRGGGWGGRRLKPPTRGPELSTDGPDHTTKPKEHHSEFRINNIQLLRSTGAKMSVMVLQGRKSSPQKSIAISWAKK